MGSLIWPLGMTGFPSKLTRGDCRPLGPRISNSDPCIGRGTLFQRRCLGLPVLSLHHIPYPESDYQGILMGLDGSNLILVRESQNRLDVHLGSFQPALESSTGSRATDITLDGKDPVLPRATKMTLIVPRWGLGGVSLRGSGSIRSVWPLEWCKSFFNFPS